MRMRNPFEQLKGINYIANSSRDLHRQYLRHQRSRESVRRDTSRIAILASRVQPRVVFSPSLQPRIITPSLHSNWAWLEGSGDGTQAIDTLVFGSRTIQPHRLTPTYV